MIPEIELTKPDTIKVEVVHLEEITADRADLDVTIRGSSLVTGETALKKAREVSQLVTELTQYGVAESNIHLQSVHAEVSSGLLGKSSSATYHLRIRCTDLAALPDILGIVTAQKNTSLRSISWGYQVDDDLEGREIRDRWLEMCIQRANQKAEKIAARLGVQLHGIHRFVDQYLDPEAYSGGYLAGGRGDQGFDRALKASARRITTDDLGLSVTHSKEIGYRVEVEYRISER